MPKKPTPAKPAAPRLSAHAELCRDIRGPTLRDIFRRLKSFGIRLPDVGPGAPGAPTTESVLREVQLWQARKAKAAARAAARRTSSLDRFVIHAWPRIDASTRARLMATDMDEAVHGDLQAREFARTIRDLLTPMDYESFIDELSRS